MPACRSAAGLYILQCLPYTLGPSSFLGALGLFFTGLLSGILCLVALGVRTRQEDHVVPASLAD